MLTLEDAVRKASAAVATRLSLTDRGVLKVGLKADVIVFDPNTITDHATFENPHQLSTGVRDMFVNGVAVLRNGDPAGVTAAVAECHRQAGPRFIVGAGCEVPRDTPAENLRALCAYAHSHPPTSKLVG